MLAELLGVPRCASCGAPGDLFCRSCSEPVPPAPPVHLPGVDAAVCAWHWSGAPRSLVLGLKLRAQRANAGPLARGTAGALWRRGTMAEVITWVPGRPRDMKRRGFDHAECIARDVAARLGLPALPLLRRAGSHRDQVGLGRGARLRNQRDAFCARSFEGAVLLIDDLITTGATATSCASALREAGASRVEVAAPCRA